MKYPFKINKSAVATTAGLALVAVLAISFVGLSQASDATHQLTVNVNDACGPVVAQVTIVNGPDDGAFGITDSNGQFTFNALHDGVFYVHVAADGHTSQDTGNIVLNSDQSITVTLDRTSGGCGSSSFVNLNFMVKAACTSAVIPGATVTIKQDFGNGTTRTTDGGGFANFGVYSNTAIGWTVSASGYQTASGTANSGSGTTVNVSMGSNCQVPPPDCNTGAGLSGKIIDPGTFNGVATARITNTSNCTYTVGFAVYKMFSTNTDDRTSQKLYHSVSRTIGPNQTINTNVLKVDLPDCKYQLDLFRGPVLTVPIYESVYLDYYFSPGNVCVNLPPSPPPPPAPTNPVLSIQKTVRNVTAGQSIFIESVSANPGDSVQFQMVVTNIGDATANNVRINDALPDHFTGSPTSFNLGNMSAGSTKTVTLTATVGPASEFPVGSSTWTNTATASASNASSVSDGARVVVHKDAPPSPPPPPPCTTGTIQVNSNLQSATYTISGASTISGTGTRTFYDKPIGDYNISVPDISGYTKSVNPTSGTLICNGTLTFTLVFTPVIVGQPALSIQKTVRNVTAGQSVFIESVSANPGDSVQFQMVVTNIGDATANNVTVSDVLPAHFRQSIRCLACTNSTDNSANFSLGNMLAGSSQTVTLTATAGLASEFPVGSSTWTNTATASASNASSVSDGAQVVVTKDTPCTTGTIQVTSNLQSATYTLSGASAISGIGTQLFFNIPIGNYSILAQDVSGYTKTINPTSGTLICNGTLSFSIIYQQISSSVSISITKSVRNITQGQSVFNKSVSANSGDSIQFQIQVTASGNASAQNVVVTDTLPNNFNLTSGSTTFNLGTMSPGSVQTVTLNGTVNQNNFCGTSTLINSAQATASNANTVSDTATVSVYGNSNCGGGETSVNLNLTKQVRNLSTGNGFSNYTNASNGDQVQFKMIVTNNGSNSTANNVRLTDYLPSGLTYVSGTFQVDNGGSYGNLFGGSQYLGSLSSNQSRTVTFNATVNASGSQTMINQASALADNAGTVNAQATVYAGGSVAGGNINLILSKKAFNQTQNIDATATTANSGDVILYTLTVQNTGNAPATNFVFQDGLSDVLELSQLQDFGSASFNLGNLSLSWPAQTIPAGGSAQQTFTVKVNSSFPSTSDYVMTNTFGNTVNVRVPRVLGVFTAPKTGSTSTLAFALSFAVMSGFAAYKKRAAILTFGRKLIPTNYV